MQTLRAIQSSREILTTRTSTNIFLDEDEDHSALRFVNANPDSSLCTIAGIEGSFSRRLGAQLAIGADMMTVGSLADGCLERELATQAQALKGSTPKVVRFGRGSKFIDFRLPCGSAIDILIDPQPDRVAIARVVSSLEDRKTANLDLALAQGHTYLRRTYDPSLQLLICGAGPEVDWLARLAKSYGLSCTTARPGNGLALGSAPVGLKADSWTAIVLLFHDHEWEGPILQWALSTSALFIGAIGGMRSRERRKAELLHRGCSLTDIERIQNPVGLIGNARDARVLGLSILSQVIECYECARTPSSLL